MKKPIKFGKIAHSTHVQPCTYACVASLCAKIGPTLLARAGTGSRLLLTQSYQHKPYKEQIDDNARETHFPPIL